MKKNYTFHFVTLYLMLAGTFLWQLPTVCQSTPIIVPDSTFTGDILHSDAGSDFIGIIYTRNGIMYYNRIGYDGIWEKEDSLGIGTDGKMEIDGSDTIHVAFTSLGKIAYRKFNGSVWSETVYIESNNGGACSRPDIAVDGNGDAHISYSDRLGDTGGQSDKDDIMYATNKSGGFIKTMIFRGYYENWGGSAYYGEYYDKGSRIAVNTNGDYFIAAHYQLFDRSSGGTAYRTYMIKLYSNLGTGSSSPTSSTDIFDVYDLVSGDIVKILHKHTGLKTAQLTLTGTTISLSMIEDIVATSVNAAADDGTFMAVGGKTNTNLFTKLNNLSHVYTNLVVKGTAIPVSALDGLFYAIYTDNADSKIKIQIVADSLSFTSFTIPSQTIPAVINPVDHTIFLEVAAGTNPADLVASFITTSDVASVKIEGTDQLSGATHNDFGSQLTYTLISSDASEQNWLVNVSVEPATFTILSSSSPAAGGSISGAGDYKEGTVATVIASANEGYAFVNWTEGESEVSTDNEYSFTVTTGRNLTANFVEQYSLTIQTTGTGSVNVNEVLYSELIKVNSGTTINLEAIAGDQYHFVEWTGDLLSVNASESVIMDGDKVITAAFAINEYTLTIDIAGTGTVNADETIYSGVITVNSGTTINLEAVAGDEYHFVEWTGDLLSVNASESVNMDGDKVITAVFAINEYTLTIDITGTGTVNADETAYSGVITVNSGTTINLEAVAGDEFHFVEWTGDLISANALDSVLMNSDKVITASFVINEYTLTITIVGEGSVMVNETAYSDVITANSGTTMDLEAVAGNGYVFTGWTGDLTSATNPEIITLFNNQTITANFELSSGIPNIANGEIEVYPNPFTEVIHLNSTEQVEKVIITALNGQYIKTLEVNGQNQLNTGNLEKGTYLMDIWLKNGSRMVKKIIRE